MDLDFHGSGLAVMMLALGFLGARYSDVLIAVANDVFRAVGLAGMANPSG